MNYDINTNRITSVLKVETDINTSIPAILEIMYVKTDVFVFIINVMTSH